MVVIIDNNLCPQTMEILGSSRIRQVIEPVLHVLEPYLILHEIGSKSAVHPAELRNEILYWQYPSPGGHLYFLDVIRAISEEVYKSETASDVRKSVLERLQTHNYNPKTGGFKEWEGRFPESRPTITATSNVISLLRHFTGVEEDQPLGYSNAVELLGQRMVEAVINFTKKSQDSSLGGFHHNPEMNHTQEGRPSIWNTRRALNIFWNLEQHGYDSTHLREFLGRCFIENLPNGGVGFCESPTTSSSHIPSSGATTSALQVLETLGEDRWIKEQRKALITFLKSCWNVDKKGLGGFSHIPGDKPFLLYTDYVLSSLPFLDTDIKTLLSDSDSRRQLIKLYEEACKSRKEDELLFGFAPGWRPNSYVMKETIYTLKSLAEQFPEFKELYQKIFGDTSKVVKGMYEFALTQKEAEWLGLIDKRC